MNKNKYENTNKRMKKNDMYRKIYKTRLQGKEYL